MNLDSGYFIHTLLAAEKALQIIVMKQFKDSRYWVTENGKIWSKTDAYKNIESVTYTLKSGVCKTYTWIKSKPEKWKKLKPQYKKGYQYYAVWLNKKRVNESGHRMVAEIYCSGYFEGAHVDHIDNNKTNNHYTNLQWCTKEYNHHKGNKTTFPLYSEWSK